MSVHDIPAAGSLDLLDRARDTLASTFGFPSFRPLQEEIVGTILRGEDVFVLLPTGGGKSLCYQLPALLREGTTIVVSPLIALMKDQVDALRAHGIAATFINSSLDAMEVKRRSAALSRGEVRLLYVAPERLMMPDFLSLLETVPVAFIAVDEAHCISEWGHDFRPEYRQLERLRALFPATPLGAFTATATSRVQADIRTHLGLRVAASFQGSFNRPNLYYDVRPKRDAYEGIVQYLREHPDASGIIYCASRAGTESLADRLRRDGFRAAAYHAGLEAGERQRRQEAFTRDDVPIIVATIAFGMGIDKPDVRFVMHYDLPKSLENYYQESGRAGRDGDPSDCILFFTAGDAVKQRRFIEEKETEAERRIASWQLQQMVDWADSATCRRRALLAYFDEPFEGQEGPCCDACLAPAASEDATIPAQMFLSCVKRTGERFGTAHIIEVLRGSRNERVLKYGHDKLSTHGIGRERTETEWRTLARELVRGGYLRQDPERFNILSVTDQGKAILFAGEPFTLTVREDTRPDTSAEMPYHHGLFERLRALRREIADGRGVPPFIIFPDRTLRQMAALLPADQAALRRVPGVGERKALDFGPAFLREIAAYVEETGVEPMVSSLPSVPPPRPRAPRANPGSSVFTTLDLFRAGEDVQAIADIRDLAVTTIENHLAQAIEAGETLDLDRVVTADKRRAIEAAFDEVGMDRLAPIMERLGDGYTYGEIRFTRAAVWQAQQRA